MTNPQNLPALTEDGFDDFEGDAGVFEGATLLKHADAVWKDRDGLPAPTVPLLALRSRTIIQRWKNKKPIELIVKEEGKPFPDVDQLNSTVPESEWEPGLNGLRPPFQKQWLTFFWNEQTGERFVHANGTIGTRIAVTKLRTAIKDMRYFRGANVFPLVELASAPMKTQFGPRQRPEFKIVGWKSAGPAAPHLAPPDGGPAGLKEVPQVSSKEAMRDEIPF